MRLAIIIPAYNEEKRIGKTLEAYSTYFDILQKRGVLEYKILVVINGTTDKTEEIVKKSEKIHKQISHLNLILGGKGYAMIEGFKQTVLEKFDLIGFVDSDMATPPEAYYDLVKKIDGFDGIIASRYLRGAIVEPKPSLRRIIASRVYNVYIRALFFMPYRDTQCGAKLFKLSALKRVLPSLTITQWAFDVDFLFQFRKKGFRIAEVPTQWSDKEYSKINFIKAGPWMALALMRLRLINSPFRDIVRLYDKIFGRKKSQTKKTAENTLIIGFDKIHRGDK